MNYRYRHISFHFNKFPLMIIIFFFINTIAGDDAIAYNVTHGSVFYIRAEDVAGVEQFERKPSVFVISQSKKFSVKVLNSSGEFKTGLEQIRCEWKTVKLDSGTYDLYIIPKETGTQTIVTESFNVKEPEIFALTPDSGASGEEITVTGIYFGSKTPKIWLEYEETLKSGKTKTRKKRCKIKKPLEYKNAKDKSGKSCMEIETGESKIIFYVPQKITESTEATFYLDNKIKRISSRFNSEDSYSISGTVSGDIQEGVSLTLNGTANMTATSGSDGSYSFTGLEAGSYTVTPSLDGYTFSPTSQEVTITDADQTGIDFTATSSGGGTTYTISGTVSGDIQEGVSLTLSGTANMTATSGSDGTYSFTGLEAGSYTVTPSLDGYTFSPTSQEVTVTDANQTGIDFTATSSGSSETWTLMPLRSQAQKDAGLSGGEGMQMIWGLSYAPSNTKILYLLSDTSQVWKSTDGGSTWQRAHEGFLANGGISLVVDPTDANTVFVAGSVNDGTLSDDVADGIYRTKDGGSSWELVRKTHYYRLDDDKGGVNFAFAGTTIYAATHEDGILKSTDNGDNWIALNILTGKKIYDIKIYPSDNSILYVSSESGFAKLTSETTLTSLGDLPTFPRAFVINSENPDIIYTSLGISQIYKSTDGGNTFTAVNSGLPSGRTTYLAISPADPNYLYVSFKEVGGNHPYYTHDGGTTWQQPTTMDQGDLIKEVTNDGGGEWWSTPIACHPTDKNTAISSGAGNHPEITTDGGNTWKYTGNGYCGARANAISWDPHDINRFAFFITDFTGCLTEDGGSTFKNLKVDTSNGSVYAGALEPKSDSKTIICAIGDWTKQKVCVSYDNAQTWTKHDDTEDSHKFIAFHPQNTDIIYAGYYKSTDNGKSWSKLSKKVAAVFSGNGDIVYAIDGKSIAKSTDAGQNWSYPYGTDTIGGTDEQMMMVAPDNQDQLFVACQSEGVYVYNGTSWSQKTDADGLEKDQFGTLNTYSIAVDPNDSNIVYAGRWIGWRGHANGIFRSTDQGVTWKNITYNLGPEFNVNAIHINPHNSYVYVASSHGTWYLPPP